MRVSKRLEVTHKVDGVDHTDRVPEHGFGKFHMKMYWWHAAHYALWNRWASLDRSSGVYTKMLPDPLPGRTARATPGYTGARWTSMTEPDFETQNFCSTPVIIILQYISRYPRAACFDAMLFEKRTR